jgi:PST family polysaccharide transporter
LRFGGALAGTQGLAYLSKNIDTVALGLVFGSTPLGFYNRAYQIVVLPLTQMTAPLTRVAIPVLSKVQDDDREFVKFLRTGQFFSVLVSSIFFGSVIGLGRPLVEVVLGPDWEPTVLILQVLAVSGIFRVLGQVPYWIFVAKGLAGTQFRFYLVAQPLVAISILCGLPWGPVGVAVGGVVGYALFWGLQMWWAGRQTTIKTLELVWSGLAIAFSVAGPLAVIGWFLSWQVTNAWLAVLIGLASTIVYVGVLVLITPTYRTHIKTVRRLMNRRNN